MSITDFSIAQLPFLRPFLFIIFIYINYSENTNFHRYTKRFHFMHIENDICFFFVCVIHTSLIYCGTHIVCTHPTQAKTQAKTCHSVKSIQYKQYICMCIHIQHKMLQCESLIENALKPDDFNQILQVYYINKIECFTQNIIYILSFFFVIFQDQYSQSNEILFLIISSFFVLEILFCDFSVCVYVL